MSLLLVIRVASENAYWLIPKARIGWGSLPVPVQAVLGPAEGQPLYSGGEQSQTHASHWQTGS